MWAAELARAVLTGFSWFVLVYFVLINSSYMVLMVLAGFDITRQRRRAPYQGQVDGYANPLLPRVAVLIPAFNEEVCIVEAVEAMFAMRYPWVDVVVIDDGSTDATFAVLQRAFDLVEMPLVIIEDVAVLGAVTSVHVGATNRNLSVVRKENSGRADSLNVGINVASAPLVCTVDADSLLDPDALLHVVQPFLTDPDRVIATGGVVRLVNGAEVVAGRVHNVIMPKQWLTRIQVVEYLRAFLLGRAGWSKLGSLLVVSGAFGLFRRDVLVSVGGMDASTIGEDAELVVRLHRRMREEGRDYRIVFVTEPVSWTEAPETAKVLARQRRRWSRGLAEIMWKHRGLIGNPRYGRIGLLAMPYYLVFELLAPLVELVGLIAVVIGLALGVVDVSFAVILAMVAFGYALVLSLLVVLIEELSFHRYHRLRDVGIAVIAMLIENLGYRQLTAWWRVQGLWAAARGRTQVWGEMTRSGFHPK